MIPTHFAISHTRLRAAVTTLAAAATIAVAVPDLAAQRGGSRTNQPARAVTGTSAAEVALRLAERLELTQEQRDQLEALRVGTLEKRAEHSARLMSLASEVRAGIRERASIREELAAAREEAGTSRRVLREQYDGILTDEQKQELRRLTRRVAWRRGAVRGGSGMDRWRGGRGQPGLDRGRGGTGRPGVDRRRGIRGRPDMDRGRGGDRWRGWRRAGEPGN